MRATKLIRSKSENGLSTIFGSRALADMMSVPNWTAYGAGQAMDVKASSVKNSMLMESNSMETVANNLGAAAANGAWKDAMSAQAELRALGGLAGAGRQAADSSTFNAYEQKARLDASESIYGSIGEAGREQGFANAFNAAAGEKATKQKVNTYGADTFLDISGKKGAFEIGRDFGSMNRHEETFGNKLNEAGEAMGDMEATNGMRNMADLNGRLATVGGDHKKLMEQFYDLGSTDQQRQMGSAEALKHKAQLMGMNIRQFQKFTDNGNTLDADTAEYLNEKYNTDVFKEGQQFRFNANKKGLTEMSITDNVKGKQLGSYTLEGTQSIILNDDGSVATNRYDGVFSKDGKTFAGGITLDGNEEIVAASGTTGSELYDKLIDTRTTQLDDHYDVMQSILSGDNRVFDRLDGLSGEKYDAVLRQLSGDLAGELTAYRNDNENQNWGTAISGGISGNLKVDSGEQLAGWVAEKLSGASVSGSANVGAGIDKQDRSESRQNVNASEIYEILKNADGDKNIMGSNVQAYLQDKISENLSGLGVATDVTKDIIDWSKSAGGVANVTIGKGPDSMPIADVVKSWEKK